MKVINTVNELQEELVKCTGTIALVPTMGALHQGHLSLVSRAVAECNHVVVTIFVNPTQFNDPKDLERYPRTLDADCALLEPSGVGIIFAPTPAEVYPEGYQGRSFDFGNLDKVMEGAARPGHFAGVSQVVSRLLEIVKPTKAYFGEKDFQQLAIIRSMVLQGGYPVEVVGCPIVRAQSGLALSSRNALLTEQQRQNATTIFSVLTKMSALGGPARQVEAWGAEQINRGGELRVEYIEIVDRKTLLKADQADSNSQICAAVHCGKIRLIDNMQCK
ncbi:MAG: pantoate--beta-alanine ligase [Mucinivorans sp.]